MLTTHFKKFLELLTLHKVEYLIVGGYAVALHGYVRATGDLDIWINQTPENADKMLSVMLHFGFSEYDFRLEDFLPDAEGKPAFVFIGEEPIKIDIIGNIAEMPFEICFQNRHEIMLDDIIAYFINLPDLRTMKKKANRSKDLNDLENLPTL